MSKLLINEHPLQVLPSLAKAIGLNEAIFLQQLHYWLQKSAHLRDGRRWVYNTVEEWQEQLPFWSVSTIRRIVNNLRKMGLITVSSQYNKSPIDKTLWYTIDYEAFRQLEIRTFAPNGQVDYSNGQVEHMEWSSWTDGVVNLNTPIPETTTETNTETTAEIIGAAPPRTPTPQQEMFGMVCEIVGWDYHALTKKDQGQVAQTIGALTKAGYTVDDLRRFMPDVWFRDWRWEKNQQRPTLSQLRQEIGKLRAVAPVVAPIPRTKGGQAVERFFARASEKDIEL